MKSITSWNDKSSDYNRNNESNEPSPSLQALALKPLSKSVKSLFICSTASLILLGQSAYAGATNQSELDALKEQVQLLMQKIEQLEEGQQKAESERQVIITEQARVEETVSPDKVVTVGDTPGSFKIPGSNTSVEISGYIKSDFIYDIDQDVGDSFAVSAISTDGSADDDNHFRAHARQSRLRVKTATDLDDGNKVRTHLEGDFFGSPSSGQSFSNGTNFRLRHAYAEYESDHGTLLAGQFWTLFGGFNYTTTLDFFAPNGQVFIRQSQLRWTFPNGFAFSIENPETAPTGAIAGGESSDGGGGKDEIPDFVLKYSGGPGGALGNYSISTVLRQLGVDGTLENGQTVDDEEFGFGVHVGGDWTIGDAFITSGIAFGEGLGRYVLADGSFNNDVYVDENGDLNAIESYGLTAGIAYNLTDTSQVNFNYGRFENINPETSSGVDNSETYHLNYLWNPWPATTFGVEAIYGERELVDGSRGDATRFQFSVQQNF